MFFFKKKADKGPQKTDVPDHPRFYDRLKKDIGPEVWAVSQDSHFICVLGEKGEDRILYRFMGSHHKVGDFGYDVNSASAEFVYRFP